MWDREVSHLRLYSCLECNRQVFICSYCDRGHIQCPGCRHSRTRRRRTYRAASRRYQSREIGRINHQMRQRRYRAKKKLVTQHTPRVFGCRAHLSAPKASTEVVGGMISRNSIVKTVYYRCHYCLRSISIAHSDRAFHKFRREQHNDRSRDRGRD
jgi:DNA-directed RNA polymerase subunit RPC12/RpoP